MKRERDQIKDREKNCVKGPERETSGRDEVHNRTASRRLCKNADSAAGKVM